MDSWLAEYLKSLPFDGLTVVQKMALEAGVADGANLVVCAPTSSGKTLIGEIAAVAAVHSQCLALYLVSHKALADQKFEDFRKQYGAESPRPFARIAISTGDRDDGEDDPQILIATYEKALSLVMSDSIAVSNTVVIADELQLLGEDGRGPDVEILCAALKQKKPKQIVALTATVENGGDLAAWLDCRLIQSSHRDIDLFQEIWADDKIYAQRFGQDDGETRSAEGKLPRATLDAVKLLLEQGRGPVLVFTETRADAMNLAAEFSKARSKTPKGFNFSEQLSLFSEATEFSDRLKATAETKVVFHTADLTPSERGVVESGLISSEFDVCFATPTLAAGVNFPFRTVLFDRIHRKYIEPRQLPLSAYRNMSGRAGRLGMHENGYAILVPRDAEELEYAKRLIGPENEQLDSKLLSMSVRRIVLSLVAAKTVEHRESIHKFLDQTFLWYQLRDNNPQKLDALISKVDQAIAWLIESDLIEADAETLAATDLGAVAARTGLLPSTALAFANILKSHATEFEGDFEAYELPLIHAACTCDEFSDEIGQRFHPPFDRSVSIQETVDTLHSSRLFETLDYRSQKQNRSAFATWLFMSGEPERKIGARSGIPSGQVHRFAGEIAWILDGVARLASVNDLNCSQKVMNSLGILARRVRLGVPTPAVDLIRTAQKARVPGFGRQGALALLRAKLADRLSILSAAKDVLVKLLNRPERVERLLEAIEKEAPGSFEKEKRYHLRVARKLGIEPQIADAYEKYGDAYEDAVEQILAMVPEWKVIRLDDGKRQGVPDILVTYQNKSLVIECKTTTKKPPAISKDEAFAVMAKAIDIMDVHRATLGKPAFDTFSQSKACGSSDVTLIGHTAFIDAILLRRMGLISVHDLFGWFLEPGVAESSRLGTLRI